MSEPVEAEPRDEDADSRPAGPELDAPLAVLMLGGCGATWILGRWLAAGGDLANDDQEGPLPFLSLTPPVPIDAEAARAALLGDGLQVLALLVCAAAWWRWRGRRAAPVVLLTAVVSVRAIVGAVQAASVWLR